MASSDPLYEFFAPQTEQEVNQALLNYDGVGFREILARYRSLFPEYASTPLDLDARTEIEKFANKVKVNVEFFEVDSPETAGSGRVHPPQEALGAVRGRLQGLFGVADHFAVVQRPQVPAPQGTPPRHCELSSSTRTRTTTGKSSPTN